MGSARTTTGMTLLAGFLVVACEGGSPSPTPLVASRDDAATGAVRSEAAMIGIDPAGTAALRAEIEQLRVDKQLLQDRVAQVTADLEAVKRIAEGESREAARARQIAEAEAALRVEQENARVAADEAAEARAREAEVHAREAEATRRALERQELEQALVAENAQRVIEGQAAQQQLERVQAQAIIDAQAAQYALHAQAQAQRALAERRQAELEARLYPAPALIPVPRQTASAGAKAVARRDWKMLPPPPENIPLLPR